MIQPGRSKQTLSVDLSSFLTEGQQFELRDARDYFGEVVLSGTYKNPIDIPMNGEEEQAFVIHVE